MLIRVKAHPKSSRVRFELKGEILHAWLTEPAEQGKANRQLVSELARRLGSCRLVRGRTSCNKTVEVRAGALEKALIEVL